MNEKKWAVVELSPLGEKESNLNLLKEDLLKYIPNLEIFFPVYWNEDTQYHHRIELMQGYIFVSGAETPKHFFLLESSKFVNSVLYYRNKKEKYPNLISNEEVEELKRQLAKTVQKNIDVDDHVFFLDGQFKHLKGKVISEINEREVNVVVLGLKSADIIVRIQKVYLEKVEMENI